MTFLSLSPSLPTRQWLLSPTFSSFSFPHLTPSVGLRGPGSSLSAALCLSLTSRHHTSVSSLVITLRPHEMEPADFRLTSGKSPLYICKVPEQLIIETQISYSHRMWSEVCVFICSLNELILKKNDLEVGRYPVIVLNFVPSINRKVIRQETTIEKVPPLC